MQYEYDIAISKCDAHIIFNKDGYIGSSALREMFMGAGNNAFSLIENNKGYYNKVYSQVYLLEECNKDVNTDVRKLIEALILKGNIKVGINQLLNDFNINDSLNK